LLRAIVRSALNAIITIDEWGIIVTVNPAAESMFGYQASEMLGMNANQFMSPESVGEHEGYMLQYRDTGVGPILGFGREVMGRRKDGSTLTVELAVSETQLFGRNLLIGTVRDITARKLLEQRLQEQTAAVRAAHEDTVYHLLKASLYRDVDTGAHMQRTGGQSALLGAAAGWKPDRVELLRLAAPMHDIGKIGIPDAILLKPGKLTPAETIIMRSHTLIGAKMLAGSCSPVLRLGYDIALCHHERWDGTGYPNALVGREIPEAARIVSIVEVYDALMHDRSYRPAFLKADALRLMRSARQSQFDPQLLDLFLSTLPAANVVAAAMETVNDRRPVLQLLPVILDGDAHSGSLTATIGAHPAPF
jgi:PAS domain S-box-containing protein